MGRRNATVTRLFSPERERPRYVSSRHHVFRIGSLRLGTRGYGKRA
ncbi:hypothetical protein CSOJ01_15743 [Colletotrichum sojae]|uniref:Uncharacterized protein n=1 Tax=Colletotrichum sojae TaxID=2175907 RepID=A0A8H6IMD2_9PEZI|nr:hypothetical protein CSOJ01_15743 [Colletotrichum sojae]